MWILERRAIVGTSDARTVGEQGATMTKFSRVHSPSFNERRQMLHNLVFFANFLLGLDYGLIMPTAWRYLKSVNVEDPFYFGLLLSGFSFTALIGGLICGDSCSYRLKNVRLTILIMNFCPLLGNALYFIGLNECFIIGGRFVSGMGVGVVTVIYSELCRSTPLEERKPLLRQVFATRQIGMAFSPLYVFLLNLLESAIGRNGIVFQSLGTDSGSIRLTADSAPGFFLFIAWALFALVFHACYDSPRCACGRPALIPANPLRREFMLERAPLVKRPRGPNFCRQCLESCPSVAALEHERQQEDEREELIRQLRRSRSRSRSRSGSFSSFYTFSKDTVVCLLFMQMLGFFCQAVVESTVAPTLDFYLRMGPQEVSFVLMALGLETLAVFLLFVAWSKKHPRRTLLAMGLILGMTIASLAALFFCVFYMAEVNPRLEIFPCYAVALCFQFLAAPGISIWTTSLLARHVPRQHQEKSVMVRRVCNYLGSILGPLWGAGVAFRPLLLYGVTGGFVLLGSAMFFASFSAIAEPFMVEERRLRDEGLAIPHDKPKRPKTNGTHVRNEDEVRLMKNEYQEIVD